MGRLGPQGRHLAMRVACVSAGPSLVQHLSWPATTHALYMPPAFVRPPEW